MMNSSSMILLKTIKNKLKDKNFIYVTIEGNIGVGKTTLLNKIRDNINNMEKNDTCFIIQEPVDIWEKTGLLNSYYSNPKQYALNFQMTAFCTTLLPIKKFLTFPPNHPPIIIFGERSPLACIECFTPLLIEQGKINSQNQTYMKFKKICDKTKPFIYPDIVFFLDGIDTTTLLKRIKNRNRLGEQNITREYLEQLRIKYNQMINSLPETTIVVKDCDNAESILRDVLNIF